MELLIGLLILIIILIVAVVLLKNGKDKGALVTGSNDISSYIRDEDGSVGAFYNPPVPYSPTEPTIANLVKEIKHLTDLPDHQDNYPADTNIMERTAKVFEHACQKIFNMNVTLDHSDPCQIDALINSHLINVKLRPFFDGPDLKQDLTLEELDSMQSLKQNNTLPDEPLLYYAMGCFWGEWLVKHRNCQWKAYDPLNPIQCFPDIIKTLNTVCLHPFSHIIKKMAHPQNERLSDKALIHSQASHYIGPFFLIASMVDAEHAVRSSLPSEVQTALDFENKGDSDQAFNLFQKAILKNPNHPKIYPLALRSAWKLEKWDMVFTWSQKALELDPINPVLNHNLAVLYSNMKDGMPKAIDLLKQAIELDPEYGRAHLTLASCYADLKNTEKAMEYATSALEKDAKLAQEVNELIASIQQKA